MSLRVKGAGQEKKLSIRQCPGSFDFLACEIKKRLALPPTAVLGLKCATSSFLLQGIQTSGSMCLIDFRRR